MRGMVESGTEGICLATREKRVSCGKVSWHPGNPRTVREGKAESVSEKRGAGEI
jgi:hypothetical protein